VCLVGKSVLFTHLLLLCLKESFETATPQVVRQAAFAHFYPSLQSPHVSLSHHAGTFALPSACTTQQRTISNHRRRRQPSDVAICSDHGQLKSFSQRMTDLWFYLELLAFATVVTLLSSEQGICTCYIVHDHKLDFF